MKTLKEWVIDNFDQNEISDICKYGCVDGFSGITYYHETCALYDQYNEDIWERLWDLKDAMGDSHVLQTIASFNGAKDVGSDTQFKNLLVWYAVEQIADELVNREEDQE